MLVVSATFVDHDEAREAVRELRDELGMREVGVAALATVDPPLAEPVLVAARVPDAAESDVRRVLASHGAALVSRTVEPGGEDDVEAPVHVADLSAERDRPA